MWRELVLRHSGDWEIEFGAPAPASSILEAETGLAIALPDELKELLSECNGISGRYGPAIVWTAERILKDNTEFRTFPDFPDLYMPFNCLLFFGDDGGGDQYGYRILNGAITSHSGIFEWVHENDGRNRVAWDLTDYLEKVLTRTLH
jgi:hypothetical protein